MTTIESSALSDARLADVAHTNVSDDAALANSESYSSDDYASWDRVIDRLIEWRRDPSVLQEDDFVVPSSATLHAAKEIARLLQATRQPPPLRVVPDGEGGVVFERRSGRVFFTLELTSDQWIEESVFVDCRLRHCVRYPVAFLRT